MHFFPENSYKRLQQQQLLFFPLLLTEFKASTNQPLGSFRIPLVKKKKRKKRGLLMRTVVCYQQHSHSSSVQRTKPGSAIRPPSYLRRLVLWAFSVAFPKKADSGVFLCALITIPCPVLFITQFISERTRGGARQRYN